MARILDQVVGHKIEIQQLAQSLQRVSGGGTFLFSGLAGIGKKLIAKGFAQVLLCEKRDPSVASSACGACGSCLRVEKNQSEGLLVLEPQGESLHAPIKTEQAQQALEFLTLKSFGRARIIIIDSAQNLNPQAANSLLKSIEEPPEGTFFFLITSNISSVLPTVKSRSQVINFKPLVVADLAKISPAPQWILKSCRGSVEKLFELQALGDEDTRLGALSQLQFFVSEPHFLTDGTWREKFKERASAVRTLSLWSQFLRDAAVLKLQERQALLNPDMTAEVEKIIELNLDLLLNLAQECSRLIFEIGQQKDPLLLLESFWIKKERGVFS